MEQEVVAAAVAPVRAVAGGVKLRERVLATSRLVCAVSRIGPAFSPLVAACELAGVKLVR